MLRVCFSQHSHQCLLQLIFLRAMILNRNEGTSLHIPGDFRHWASCHKHGSHLCVYFEMCPFRSLSIFYCIIYLSAVKLWGVFVGSNMIFLPDMWLTYMFWWLLDHCLFILLIVLQFYVLCPVSFFLSFFSFVVWDFGSMSKKLLQETCQRSCPLDSF